jgi:hypothetical protein
MQIDKDLFYESLHKKLNPRSGKFQPIGSINENGWVKVLDIKWKGGIHFIVERSCLYRWGWCYVMRDGQLLSPMCYIAVPSDKEYESLQHHIDDIEDGKYKNKKTLREQVKSFIEERSLVSYMNNTKWRELVNDIMEKATWDCIQYKTLFNEAAPEPNVFWDLHYDEDYNFGSETLDLSDIEWMKIKHVETVREHIGLLVPDKIQTIDHKSLILEILQKHSIPYEYNEAEQTFTIYGYR